MAGTTFGKRPNQRIPTGQRGDHKPRSPATLEWKTTSATRLSWLLGRKATLSQTPTHARTDLRIRGDTGTARCVSLRTTNQAGVVWGCAGSFRDKNGECRRSRIFRTLQNGPPLILQYRVNCGDQVCASVNAIRLVYRISNLRNVRPYEIVLRSVV